MKLKLKHKKAKQKRRNPKPVHQANQRSLPKTSAAQGESATSNSDRLQRIRYINDFMRFCPLAGCDYSPGFRALPDEIGLEATFKIATFKDFNAVDDPTGEHRSGKVIVGGQTICFEFIYFDEDSFYPCADPADDCSNRLLVHYLEAERYIPSSAPNPRYKKERYGSNKRATGPFWINNVTKKKTRARQVTFC